MARIFLTGASGYIGGEVVHQLARSFPGHQIRALLRNPAHSEAITTISSNVEVVIGDLDDTEMMTREAAGADVVLHLAATGHLGSAEAIFNGLSRTATTQTPKHWIQISGATALAAAELADASREPGSASNVIFDDLHGTDDILAAIRNHPSRAVDNLVLTARKKSPGIKTALVFGSIIYGEGSGPINTRSIQIPSLAKATLQRKRGLQVGAGLSRWGNIHIGDLGRMIIHLIRMVSTDPSDENVWGENGIYLTGVGELSFGEISTQVAVAAHEENLIEAAEVDEIRGVEANTLLPHGNVLFGTNARGRPTRAEKILGWAPTEHSLEKEVSQTLVFEARALGLI